MNVDWVLVEKVDNGFIIRCGNNERNGDEASLVTIASSFDNAFKVSRSLLEDGLRNLPL